MTRVRWNDLSRNDLRRIIDWLTEYADGDRAERTLSAIRYQTKFLTDFPRAGRPFRGGTRILRVPDTRYLMNYRVTGDLDVEILRIFHERENWQVAVP